MSQVKISGMDINVNTITTIQQNKTLNSVNFTNCNNASEIPQQPPVHNKVQSTFKKKPSQFKMRKLEKSENAMNDRNLANSDLLDDLNNQIEESKEDHESNSVSASSGSEVVRLFKNGDSPKLQSEKRNRSDESEVHKENIVDNKSNTLFPSFESDERDENVPKLCNSDQSVSDDSIGDVINIKFCTYRRNLLVKEYIFEVKNNYSIMHSSSRKDISQV